MIMVSQWEYFGSKITIDLKIKLYEILAYNSEPQ